MRAAGWLALIGLFGCKAPVEAPEELGEVSLFLYANFDGEDEVLAAGITNLDAFLASQDMGAALNDRAVTLPILGPEDQGGVTAPPGVDPNVQVPVGVFAASAHALADHVALVADPNQICIASDSTVYAARTFLTPIDCFVDGSCPRVDTDNETRTETLIADVWIDIFGDYRRVPLEDGREAMIARGWIDQVFLADGGNNSWDQRFTLDVWVPDDAGGTRRFYGMWSSATLGIGDDVYASLVKSGLDEYFANADGMASGEVCGNDRDRPYDRPQE